MEKFAKPGDFCPNETCPDHGKQQEGLGQRNIKKVGRTKKGVQRYQCKTCGITFTETIGTILYRKRTPQDEILETLALLAEGSRISSLSRAKGHTVCRSVPCKEDTILAWLREAAQHAEQLEEVLMADFKVKRGQLDALWSYVGHKGEKKAMPKRR